MPTPIAPRTPGNRHQLPPPILAGVLRFLLTYWRLYRKFPDTARVAERFRCPRYQAAMDMIPLVHRGFVRKTRRDQWYLTEKGFELFGDTGSRPGASAGP